MNAPFVLLVDDEAPFVETMTKRLTKRNLRVIMALSGQEALEKQPEANARSSLLCQDLSSKRAIEYITSMPSVTRASYRVRHHNFDEIITRDKRESYFLGLNSEENKVIFLNPDNGFEPETRYNGKHVCYLKVFSINYPVNWIE